MEVIKMIFKIIGDSLMLFDKVEILPGVTILRIVLALIVLSSFISLISFGLKNKKDGGN